MLRGMVSMSQRDTGQGDRPWIMVMCVIVVGIIAALLIPLAWFVVDILWIGLSPETTVNVITEE
jgi:hypothetical protein